MGRYRDRLQIIADILYIAGKGGKGAKKTQIMYQANLSYRLLCRYLGEVLDADLVSFENGKCYVLTDRGKKFLSRHEEYSKRCKSLQKHLDHVNNEKTALKRMCFNLAKVNNNRLNHLNKNRELRKEDARKPHIF